MSFRKPSIFLAVAFMAAALVPTLAWSQQDADPAPASVQVAKFDIDATPPVDFMMAYDRVRRVEELGLRCRGVVISGRSDKDGSVAEPAFQPIVVCAVDWIGIGNDSQTVFKQTLARAAATTPDRVAVHTLHQHDAPRSDLSAEALLNAAGVSDLGPHAGWFTREVLQRLEQAVTLAVRQPTPVTHVGHGVADVDSVASNRRIMGDDGRVRAVRYTTARDPAIRAEPVGVIDPELSCVSFWHGEVPVAVLSYYACHPQSYYRTGIPSPDFPGIARFMRGQDVPDVLHVHFNGAGGNIGAGKYNDGAKENRLILATRMADAMKRAFDTTTKFAVQADDVTWHSTDVLLPPAPHLEENELVKQLTGWSPDQYWGSPDKLAWLRRCKSGDPISISCLGLGSTRILHMPGELFVEYQLAAKAMRPDLNVAMAAYGDYGPGYIGTQIAYTEGGYETSERASNVAPQAETVLRDAMKTLLDARP